MKPQKRNFSTSVLKKATAFVLAISLCVSNRAMPVEAKETVNNVSMKETITEQTNSKEVYSEEKAETYMVRTPEDGMAPMKDFDYYYSDRSEGMVIEYYRGNETEVVIPNEIEGKPVTEISNEVFYENEKIISIEIPANVIDIMDGAFAQCLNLMEIKVDSDNPYYSSENGVLYDKNKTTIMSCPRGKQDYEFLPSVTSIGDYAFYGCSNWENVEIPSRVTQIGMRAFGECSGLKNIEIPSSVTDINYEAFYCSRDLKVIYCTEGSAAHIYATEWEILVWFGKMGTRPNDVQEEKTEDGKFGYVPIGDKKIEITSYYGNEAQVVIPSEVDGKKVVSIASEAFKNHRKLKSIVLQEGIVSIGDFAFLKCNKLETAVLPETLKIIGMGAFSVCESLVNINIPENVVAIYAYAFNECRSLMEIEIPEGVTILGTSQMFFECSSLKNIKLPSNLQDIGWEMFSGCTSLENVEIPEGVTHIGTSAFANCSSLKEIELPSSLSSIEQDAFYNCSSLISIEIPAKVEEWYGDIFVGCTNLQEINVDIDNRNYSSENGVLYNKDKTIILRCPSGKAEYEFLTSVREIGNSAFYGCNNLINIELPLGITTIGGEAFGECNKLESIKIPKTVTYICDEAFYNCQSLEKIEIPDSVRNIGEDGNMTFLGCNNLREINVDENNEEYSSKDGVLYNKDKTMIICCPGGRENYEFLDGVTKIRDYAFANCTNLKYLDIPSSITSIGPNAFYECINLVEIKLPDNIEYMGEFIFEGCSSLLSVKWPIGITNVPYGMFARCSSLVELELPSSIINIDSNAFGGCSNLKTIHIPAATAEIDSFDFSDCVSLMEINVDPNNSFYSSEDGVLYDKDKTTLFCMPSGKENYEFLPSVTKIERFAFSKGNRLQSVTIPSYVTELETYAFYYCDNLTEVKVSDSITELRYYTFKGCNNLEKVEIPPSVNYIDEDVFLDCPNVTIYCTEGSTAHQYAIKYGIPFILTDTSFRVTLSSVVNGTTVSSIANLIGGGVYNKGEIVTVTAPEKVGYNFIGWFAKDAAGTTYVVKNALSTENTYTFTATETDLVAVYVPDGKVALTVTDTTNVIIKDTNADTVLNNGIGVTPGTKITVTYDLQEGEEFLYWKNASGKVVSTDTVYTFTLINNTTLTPVVKTTEADKLLVEYLNEYNQVLSVEVWITEDTLSSVTPSKLGYICKGWALELNATETISADKIWEKSADGYVKLYPVYEKVTEEHTITYKNNSADAIAQTTTVELGATYTVNAEDVAVEGQKFIHWTIGNEIVSYNTSYTFLVTGDITVTAVFVAEETTVEKESILEITSQYEIKNGETVEKVAFVASREIAEGYTLLEHGMLYAKDSDITDANGFIEGVEGVNKFTASGTGMKGAFTLNVRLGNATSLKVRAYAIVKNNTTGEVTTLYSGMNTYNKNN